MKVTNIVVEKVKAGFNIIIDCVRDDDKCETYTNKELRSMLIDIITIRRGNIRSIVLYFNDFYIVLKNDLEAYEIMNIIDGIEEL